MSDAVIISAIGGVVALGSLLLQLLIKNKQEKTIQKQEETIQKQIDLDAKVDEYHKEVNGHMGELLLKTELLAKAEQKAANGKIDGQDIKP